MDKLTQQANRHYHPKKKTLCFMVVHCNVNCFESDSAKLCQHYINQMGLIGAKIKTKK